MCHPIPPVTDEKWDCGNTCHPDGAVLWRRRTHANLPAALVADRGCIGPPAKNAGHQDDKWLICLSGRSAARLTPRLMLSSSHERDSFV